MNHSRAEASAVLVLLLAPLAVPAQQATKAPFPYVPAKAYYILPETHNNESGYFSLCAGLDGKVYVGTTKYGVNSFLVEFDPKTEKQRIVVDVHKLCGLTAIGFAAQAKIHTPNFVGPSGVIYIGSKQGYPIDGDKQEFGGGYLMTYDPRTGKGENLGMPLPKYGVGDVVADEARGLLYIVAERVLPSQPMRWLVYETKAKKYRELGPNPTPYATTLVDARGRAFTLTDGDMRLAQYDPATDKVTLRDLEIDGKKYVPAQKPPIPTWQLAADGRTAYMILMSDPTLIAIDLQGDGPAKAKSLGKLTNGKGPDCRCGMAFGPDGKVYAVIRTNNETKFGGGFLHNLIRCDPASGKIEDLGVLAVQNPDFFNFGPRSDGKAPPWSHGFHKLPDGTLTPLHHHMALVVGRDGTVYITIIYPFTLLKVDAFRKG